MVYLVYFSKLALSCDSSYEVLDVDTLKIFKKQGAVLLKKSTAIFA
jgi:hypothetical protein